MKKRITPGLLVSYKKHLICDEKSPVTIEKYLRDIQRFYDYLPADKRIGKKDVSCYKEFLLNRYQASSVNSMLAALNSFFTFLGRESLKVKRIRVQRQLFRSENLELNVPDYQRLLRAASRGNKERLYLIMLTICSTGIRVSELPYITREALGPGRTEVSCKNKTRTILIPAALNKLLLSYSNRKGIKSGSIFVTRSGRPVDRRNIWKQMKALAESAGVDAEKIFPHNLRHLFARTYYAKERDIVKLADILGHSSIETTRIYTCTTISEHRSRIDHLGLMPDMDYQNAVTFV